MFFGLAETFQNLRTQNTLRLRLAPIALAYPPKDRHLLPLKIPQPTLAHSRLPVTLPLLAEIVTTGAFRDNLHDQNGCPFNGFSVMR